MKYLITIITLICLNSNTLLALPTSTANTNHEEIISQVGSEERVLNLKGFFDKFKIDKKAKSSKESKSMKQKMKLGWKIVIGVLSAAAVLALAGFVAISFLWRA